MEKNNKKSLAKIKSKFVVEFAESLENQEKYLVMGFFVFHNLGGHEIKASGFMPALQTLIVSSRKF